MTEDKLLYVLYSDLKPRERACVLARCKTFQEWVTSYTNYDVYDEEDAAQFVRAWCDVRSRNDIEKNPDALKSLDNLHEAFVKFVEEENAKEEKVHQVEEDSESRPG